MSTWNVVYERTATGWSAYVPGLPGIGAAGASREETEALIAGAVALHLEGLVEDGTPTPRPDVVEVGSVQPVAPT